jgi:hypothetical protein
MNRSKRSIIWKISDKDFINLVKNSKRIKDILDYFNLPCKGGNFKTVKKRIEELNIDTTHLLSRTDSSNFTRILSMDDILKECLIQNSKTSRLSIKRYILKHNLLEYKCRNCENLGFWNQKELSLQLEHINGVSNDHRLENLCFLCPNCHSQTDTFAGKCNKKKMAAHD